MGGARRDVWRRDLELVDVPDVEEVPEVGGLRDHQTSGSAELDTRVSRARLRTRQGENTAGPTLVASERGLNTGTRGQATGSDRRFAWLPAALGAGGSLQDAVSTTSSPALPGMFGPWEAPAGSTSSTGAET